MNGFQKVESQTYALDTNHFSSIYEPTSGALCNGFVYLLGEEFLMSGWRKVQILRLMERRFSRRSNLCETFEEKSKMIISNKAKCRLCDDVVESKHRHDFVTCKCGEIFVDGGTTYLRRGATNFDNFIDLSETTAEKDF
jgi:hypothetical protein